MGPQFIISLALCITTTAVLAWIWYRRRNKGVRKLLEDPNVKHELKLIERKDLSHNTRLFRFQLPSDTCLGLEPGQHIYLSAVINESLVVRTYSPVSTNQDIGFFEIIVKVYFRDTHPQFPNGGKMSQFLNELNLGEFVHVRGPSGRMVYKSSSQEFLIQDHKKSLPRTTKVNKINMIAGGSGITPMLQILKAIFMGESDLHGNSSVVSLIYANQTEDDILCRSDLDELVGKYPERLKVWYTLSVPPQEWTYGTGRVSREMFQHHLYPPCSDSIQLVCGPSPMVTSTSLPALMELGYETQQCFVY